MQNVDRLNQILRSIEPNLEIDSNGEAQYESEDGNECLIGLLDDDRVLFAVPLLLVPEENFIELFSLALLINDDLLLTGAARISLSADDQMLYLKNTLPIDDLSEDVFAGMLSALLALAGEIQFYLQAEHMDDTANCDAPTISPPSDNWTRI